MPAAGDDSCDFILASARMTFKTPAGASPEAMPAQASFESLICEAKRVELGVSQVESKPHRLAGLDLVGEVV